MTETTKVPPPVPAATPSPRADRSERARLSHLARELRNPLMVIAGYAELLQEDARDDQLQKLAAITAAVAEFTVILDRLLAFTAAGLGPEASVPVITAMFRSAAISP